MILDRLERASLYYGLGPRIQQALVFLQTRDLAALPPGKHPLEGDDLFALVQEYDTRPRDRADWEAHRKYVDVQYVARGREAFGCTDLSALQAGPYDEKADLLRLAGDGPFFTASAGMFFILFPHDAHMPARTETEPQRVRKIVVKVRA